MSHPKITRVRGDTAFDRFVMTNEAGVIQNITGWSFKMTVDPARNPTSPTNNLYTLVGVIDDAVNGEYSFAPTAMQADQTPGDYWFDIEATDGSGNIKTVELNSDGHRVGRYIYEQDISK